MSTVAEPIQSLDGPQVDQDPAFHRPSRQDRVRFSPVQQKIFDREWRKREAKIRDSEHYAGLQQPSLHAEAIKSRGEWIPGVIDPAAQGRSQADGEQLIALYRRFGLKLQPAVNAVEAGIYATWQMMSSGKLKVFASLGNWLQEFRLYARDKDGKVIKANDHLMDATRYLIVSGLSLMQNQTGSGKGVRPARRATPHPRRGSMDDVGRAIMQDESTVTGQSTHDPRWLELAALCRQFAELLESLVGVLPPPNTSNGALGSQQEQTLRTLIPSPEQPLKQADPR